MYQLVGMLFLVFAQMTMFVSHAAANKLPPPSGFVATSSTNLDGAVDLRWSAVKGASSYTIAASRESEDNWQVLDTVTGTEFQVNELPEATKYYFRISSNTKAGQGDWSHSVSQYSSGKKRNHSLLIPVPGNHKSMTLAIGKPPAPVRNSSIVHKAHTIPPSIQAITERIALDRLSHKTQHCGQG